MTDGSKMTMAQRRKRDLEIFDAVLSGTSEAVVAQQYGLSTRRVYAIVQNVSARLGPAERTNLRAGMLAELDLLRALVMEAAVADPAPAVDSKGHYIRMPDSAGRETDEVARDYGARIAATRAVVSVHERMARLAGLDAPSQSTVDTTVHYTVEGVDLGELK